MADDDDPVEEFVAEFGGDDSEDSDGDADGLMPGSERSPDDIGPGSTASTPPGAGGDGASRDSADGDDDAPLSDLRREVDERRSRDETAGEDEFEELFSEMEVGDVDADEVWEQLSEGDDPMFEASFVEESREVTVVEKSLCHGCEHFADPPETGCTHEGTDIDAEVDTGHFRVMDCPVVAERREMEGSDFSADDE